MDRSLLKQMALLTYCTSTRVSESNHFVLSCSRFDLGTRQVNSSVMSRPFVAAGSWLHAYVTADVTIVVLFIRSSRKLAAWWRASDWRAVEWLYVIVREWGTCGLDCKRTRLHSDFSAADFFRCVITW